MESRMKHPAMIVPGAMKSLHAFAQAASDTGIAPEILEMAHLRASQINGCSICVLMHTADLRKRGVSEDRITAISAWRETPFYSDAERAALALAESVTRIADKPDAVPDPVWNAAAAHFDEQQLAGLLLGIAGINVWNRLNAATHQMAGTAW